MITISAEQLARAEVLLKNVPNGVSKAVVSALNRAAESARADAVRKVRERYYIKAQDVRSEIKITKATLDNQAAIIHATGEPVPLSKFRVTPAKPPAKRRKNPIIVRVVRGGGGPVKGAFVAQMQSGHIGVFHRAGRARLPIIQRFGPSIPQMLGHESVVTYVEERAQELLESRLEHEIERLLRGVGK
ncbi:phage tail protein [Moorella sp. E306M]|uniref:phage tail protein n=1 Tax=Moorella sp. E306M TaxID=2572683 RepID=UPI0010FFBA73|nr:phage tail protein [Moorella sp. E306M]GEA17744.1 hypothetical protein E306M_08780 [Moorella sp. E306M]GEA17813.1 hypothetical protein E306M_09470 [Moorella sp. E306M]